MSNGIKHWDCECEGLTKGECVALCDGCLILKPQVEDDFMDSAVDIWFNNHQSGILVSTETARKIGYAMINMANRLDRYDPEQEEFQKKLEKAFNDKMWSEQHKKEAKRILEIVEGLDGTED